jgi:hypothetical protein
MVTAWNARKTRGREWIEAGLDALDGRPLAQARLLQTTDELATVWRVAHDLGEHVERAYWREFSIIGERRRLSLGRSSGPPVIEPRASCYGY